MQLYSDTYTVTTWKNHFLFYLRYDNISVYFPNVYVYVYITFI